MAAGLARIGSKPGGASAYAFHRGARAEGTAGDCLTVAAALLLLPSEGGPALLSEGWRPLAQRAAALIGPEAAAGEAAAGLAAVQRDVRALLAEQLAGSPPADDPAALLPALCTEPAPGGGTSVLPPYRLALRPARTCAACGWREEGGERQLFCVEVTSADVAATDSVLHNSPSLFDLQKALWGCAALRGAAAAAAPAACPNPACSGGAAEARLEVAALPEWLFVVLRQAQAWHVFGTPIAAVFWSCKR